ncbi:MAG TPA: hypothetical protein PKE47_03960 [Verrucomicrobiota bacterium]|nr:hypothetical protein [Verrucomicrobiota bacterium]
MLFEEDCPLVALPDTAAGGVFTLRVLNNTAFQHTPQAQVRPVTERVLDLVDLSGGAIPRFLEGNIGGPGSRDVHRFLLPDNVPVAFGIGQFSACHDWELVNAAGQRVFGPVRSCEGRARTATVPAGEYRLILTGTVDSTSFHGGYSLVAGRPGVETTAHDLREARLLEANESASLPGHRRVFEVDLDAGQVVEISFGSGGEGCEDGLTFRLLAPDGSVLAQTESGECGRSGILELGPAGRHRVEVAAEPDAPPQNWHLRLERSRLAAGQWVALPGAEQVPAFEPAVFNEGGSALLVRGGGAEIFLAGRFNGRALIGRLAGGAWQTLGEATREDGQDVRVNVLAHDGAALFAAGNFPPLGGVAASGVARWDGAAWQPLGGGVRVTGPDFPWLWEVRDLAFVGGQLYAGGLFREAGGVGTFNLARWTGAGWAKVTGPQFNEHLDGVGGQRNSVGESADSLAVLGDTLFIAGNYQFPSRNVGAWRSHQFADGLLGGVQQSTFDRGTARLVRVANGQAWFQGNFRRAGVNFGNLDVDGFAVWTGTEWRRAPTLLPYHDSTRDFAVDGDRIVVGGSFNRVFNDFFGRPEEERDTIPVNGLAIWDGARWFSAGLGVEIGREGGGGGGGGEAAARADRGRPMLQAPVLANARLGDRSGGTVNRLQVVGSRIYVTGRFTHAGGAPAPGFAVWEVAP